MSDFLAYELLPRIWNMSIAASVVIVFVLAARLLLKKAPKVFSYALWSVVLFRLLCPFSIPTGFSLLALTDAPIRQTAAHTTQVQYVQPDLVHTEFPQVDLPVPGVSQAVNQALPQGEEQLVADPLEAPVALLTLGWMAGMALMAVYSVLSMLRLRRRLVEAVPLRDNIYLADHIASPFVLGVLRPKIYLPSTLSAEEQKYIILHEQYHIKRLDHLVKLLAFFALCIHWFNPLVWLSFFLAQKDMEMSCDEAVLQTLGGHIRADYSASLLSLSTGRRGVGGTPLAFGEGNAKGRIQNLLTWNKPRKWVVALAALVCVAVVASCGTNPEAGKSQGEKHTPTSSQDGQGEEALSALTDYLSQLQEGDNLTLSLSRNGGEPIVYEDCWSAINSVYNANQLKEVQWNIVEATAPGFSSEQSPAAVTIAQINDWSLTAYSDAREVRFEGPTGEVWLAPQSDSCVPYQQLRDWFDELEYAALNGDYEHQNLVIPNEGQSYLEAAQAYCQAYESFHLQATSGSKFCYTYVAVQVREAQEETDFYREQGKIGENTYCFFLTTVFVPENDYALNWSMAGNTGEYTGTDPSVPEGALEYLRCGYITLEEDGWHGEVVGTGF